MAFKIVQSTTFVLVLLEALVTQTTKVTVNVQVSKINNKITHSSQNSCLYSYRPLLRTNESTNDASKEARRASTSAQTRDKVDKTRRDKVGRDFSHPEFLHASTARRGGTRARRIASRANFPAGGKRNNGGA